MQSNKQVVLWAGKPEHWTPPAIETERTATEGFYLAATDAAVVEVASALPLLPQTHTISRDAALNCLDRSRLRRVLRNEFNPRYERFPWYGRHAVKAPASAANSGVVFTQCDPDEIANLTALGAEVLYGVIEEFVEGDAVEISGFRLKGQTFFFPCVRQIWNADWTKIERYTVTTEYWWLPNLTDKALNDVGLDNSCFCVEWRVQEYKKAKVVEINPRWGSDGNGYCVTARGSDGCEWVEREARRILGLQ